MSPTTQSEPAASRAERAPKRLLISGHSLTDQPLPGDLEAIAQSLGSTIDWNRQYAWGTTIRQRSLGQAGDGGGYRSGLNRSGENLDIPKELRTAGASATPYDTLVIAEMHDLLSVLAWSDSVRFLRNYQDVFISGNPRGQTWLFEAWWDVSNMAAPQRWIAYERAASTVWQCVATRINVSLAAEGRADRIASLPVGAGLAFLVEQATQGHGVAGIGVGHSDPTQTEATLRRLFRDDVHLTPLGSYYVALVTYAIVFDRSPVGAWAPAHVSPEQAASLQRVAGEFLAGQRAAPTRLDLPACREHLHESFIPLYAAYFREGVARKQMGTARAYVQAARHRAEFHWRFSRDDDTNPFHYDAANDAAYWLRSPGP